MRGTFFRGFTSIYVKLICGMLSETAQVNFALSYSLLFYDRILIIKLCLLLVLCVVVVPFKHMHWILISTRGRLD